MARRVSYRPGLYHALGLTQAEWDSLPLLRQHALLRYRMQVYGLIPRDPEPEHIPQSGE